MATFGVIFNDGKCTPVSNSERGAKNYATRNGFDRIGQISGYSMTVYNIKQKVNGKWVEYVENSSIQDARTV